MRKTKGWITIVLILGLVVLLFGIGIVATSQSFSIVTEQVYTPVYWTAQCVPRTNNLVEIQIDSHTDDATWYHCNNQESTRYGRWIPQVADLKCIYRTSGIQSITTDVRICKGDAENLNNCGSDVSTSSNIFEVRAGDSLYVNTDVPFGDADLFVKYPSYGLLIEQADQFKLPTTNSCLIGSAGGDFTGVDVGNEPVIPDFPVNVVNQFTPAISDQVVRITDIANGEMIYIQQPNYYYPIIRADDGRLIVDTRKPARYDAKIECIPRSPGCSDDAKRVKITQATCDLYGGSFAGYNPIENNPTKLCRYDCINGNPSATNDCIAVPTEACPSDKPIWNVKTGTCEKSDVGKFCPDGLPIGDRIYVDQEITTCQGSLLCEIGVIDPVVSKKAECRMPNFFETYGLAIVIILGALLVGVAVLKRK